MLQTKEPFTRQNCILNITNTIATVTIDVFASYVQTTILEWAISNLFSSIFVVYKICRQ